MSCNLFSLYLIERIWRTARLASQELVRPTAHGALTANDRRYRIVTKIVIVIAIAHERGLSPVCMTSLHETFKEHDMVLTAKLGLHFGTLHKTDSES